MMLMFEWIILNGMYSPYPPFNLLMFVTLELFTFIIEFLACYPLGKRLFEKWTIYHALVFTLVMNAVSMILAFAVWLELGVGL